MAAASHRARLKFISRCRTICHLVIRRTTFRNLNYQRIKWIALAVGTLLAFTNLRTIRQSLDVPYAYFKDFTYDYISAKASLNGEDPYVDAQTLTRRHLAESPVTIPDHPSSHTPVSISLVAPLAAILTYRQAAIAWCLIELLLIACCAFLFWQENGERKGWRLWMPVAVTSFLFLGWGPVKDEIGNGQWTIVLLALLMVCQRALRTGRSALGGVALGAAMAVKLSGAPILIFLTMRKRWRAVGWATFTAALCNLLAAGFIGWPAMMQYYLRIGAEVTHIYRAAGHNYALWTLGWRVFEGSLAHSVIGFSAPPLFNAPQLARPASIAVCGLVLLVGLWLARQLDDREEAYGILIHLTLLLNPVSWTYHIPLTIIPLSMTYALLKRQSFPRKETIFCILLLTIISLPFSAILAMQQSFGAADSGVAAGVRISFPVGMLSLAPAASLAGLTVLLYHLTQRQDRSSGAQTAPPEHRPAG